MPHSYDWTTIANFLIKLGWNGDNGLSDKAWADLCASEPFLDLRGRMPVADLITDRKLRTNAMKSIKNNLGECIRDIPTDYELPAPYDERDRSKPSFALKKLHERTNCRLDTHVDSENYNHNEGDRHQSQQTKEEKARGLILCERGNSFSPDHHVHDSGKGYHKYAKEGNGLEQDINKHQIGELRDERDALHTELEQARHEIEVLGKRVEELELRTIHQDAAREKAVAQAEKRSEDHITQLHTEIAHLENANAALTGDTASLKSAKATESRDRALSKEYKKQIMEQDEQIRGLQTAQSQMEAQLQVSNRTAESLRGELGKMAMQSEGFHATVLDLKEQLSIQQQDSGSRPQCHTAVSNGLAKPATAPNELKQKQDEFERTKTEFMADAETEKERLRKQRWSLGQREALVEARESMLRRPVL